MWLGGGGISSLLAAGGHFRSVKVTPLKIVLQNGTTRENQKKNRTDWFSTTVVTSPSYDIFLMSYDIQGRPLKDAANFGHRSSPVLSAHFPRNSRLDKWLNYLGGTSHGRLGRELQVGGKA